MRFTAEKYLCDLGPLANSRASLANGAVLRLRRGRRIDANEVGELFAEQHQKAASAQYARWS